MNIVVVSDSHTNINYLTLIRERHLSESDLFLHCGDSTLMSDHPALNGYLTVRGNCDFDLNYPLERVEKLDDRDTLLMTHGHKYDVKYSLQRLYYHALEVGATIVCYGHSHCIAAEMGEGILFLNPGSITLPHNTKEKTYALITTHPDHLEVTYFEVNSGKALIQQTFNR